MSIKQDVEIERLRHGIKAIQRETQFGRRVGVEVDPARDFETISMMCEALLDGDFAEEIGVACGCVALDHKHGTNVGKQCLCCDMNASKKDGQP